MEGCAVPTDGVVHAFDTNDFEHFDELVRQWNLETTFLDKGPFRGGAHQIATPSAAVGLGWFRGAVRQRGAPPPGMRTVLMTAVPGQHFHWRGALVSDDHVVVHPAGGEVDGHTSSCLDILTISLHESVLGAAAERSGLRGLDEIAGGGELVRVPPRELARLRRAALRIVRRGIRSPKVLGEPELRADLSERLPALLLAALDGSQGDAQRRHRTTVFLSAVRLVQQRADDPITVAELSAALGASERTIRRAFVEHCDVSPQQYILRWRLHCVRQALQRPGAGTVAGIANRWGFWHMGEFAAHYRSAFGELPSDTRSRAAGTRTGSPRIAVVAR